MRSARALPGFRGFGGSVRSRVARSIARRVATRDTTRLRRPDPSIAPIERARSNERLKARVREPENADGGGFHASGALAVFASRTRASAPVFAVPDAAAPSGRGSLLRGLLLHRGPALVDHRARLDRARGRREKKVSPCCSCSPIARRARGNGDDDADAFAREPGRFDAPASTGVRLPSAGTFTNAHRTRWRVRTTVRLGGADTRLSQRTRTFSLSTEASPHHVVSLQKTQNGVRVGRESEILVFLFFARAKNI